MNVLSPSRRELPGVDPAPLSFTNPLRGKGATLVTRVGNAEGSRGAAAALACAGAGAEAPGLLVDLGGRDPRPTLIATTAAQELEERLRVHLPQAKAAARGQVCHLTAPADLAGLEAAAAALSVARGAQAVLHLPPALLQPALDGPGLEATAALLRADLRSDRALVALLARDLIERGLDVAVLKRRLAWVAERRALFGALPAGSPGGLPERLGRRLGWAAG